MADERGERTSSLDIRHIFRETRILILDLERQFTGMTKNDHSHFIRTWFDLLQGSQHEHSRFTHTRFRLTQNIGTENGLWDTFLLNCRQKKGLR